MRAGILTCQNPYSAPNIFRQAHRPIPTEQYKTARKSPSPTEDCLLPTDSSGVHVLEKLPVIFRFYNLFAHELHALDRVLVRKIFAQKPRSG